jgi:MerR family transcriptional regulator/heat shock protein HspR
MKTKEPILGLNTELDMEKPMFPISVIADVLKVHQRTLRIYDEEELLTPSRSPKNRRLYSMKDIELGKFIQYLTKEMGINLAGIKIIFNLLDKQNIPLPEYINYISTIAKELNITPEMQQKNREKLSKRGRKKKVEAQV